jgi:transcription antitermination factor NusG
MGARGVADGGGERMIAARRLDPQQVREAEAVAERKWGPEWRSNRLDRYMAEMLGAEVEPAASQDFSGQWFVVQTAPQQEKTVAAGLIGRRFDCYLPMRRRKVNVAGRRARTIDCPMLSGYLFVAFDPAAEDWKRINSIAGVICVLGFDVDVGDGIIEHRPLPVPKAAMLRLRDKELEYVSGARVLRINEKPLALGDLVQVGNGPFTGFFGRVIDLLFKREQVVVEIDMFGRATPATVELGKLQRC